MIAIATAFIVSVAAGVTSYYICKWLDGKAKKHSQPEGSVSLK